MNPNSPIPPAPSPKTRLAWFLLALCGIAAAVLLYIFDPTTTSYYPPCPLHSLTGLDCPTCGGLRAAHQLLHGHVRTAFALNPILFFALPIAGLFLIRPALARPRWVPWAALAILIAYFLYRNWA